MKALPSPPRKSCPDLGYHSSHVASKDQERLFFIGIIKKAKSLLNQLRLGCGKDSKPNIPVRC